VIPIPVETDIMLAILNLPKEMSNNAIFKEHQGLVMEMIHSYLKMSRSWFLFVLGFHS